MYLNARAKSFLGNQLINEGIITQDQLDNALQRQQKNRDMGLKGLLGQTLVDMGYCTEEQIAKAMAKKSGFSFMTLNNQSVDMTATNLISAETAQKYKALPIGFENDKLLVALMNPNDIITLDNLRIMTGYDIQPVVVPDKELTALLDQFTNASSNVEKEEEENLDNSDDGGETGSMGEKPAVQLANQIFNQSILAGASDIHVEPQEKKLRIRFRIDGVLHDVMQQNSKLQALLASRIKVMANMDIAERRIPQDGRITLKLDGKVIDVRVATLPSAYGEKITMRLMDRGNRLITLEELGFPDSQLRNYSKVMRMPYGFILITGPTGSGKSTTLYATLAELNSIDKNIITLEDPIERRMDGLNQVQVNFKAGMTFASGLRSILRSDPDIIMVGEIRDKDTAKIAVESALTGHLVLSTLHTNDAAGAVTRLGEMGVEPYLTASSLIGVVAQRLMRVLCPVCKKLYHIDRDELLRRVPDFPLEPGEKAVNLYHASGCIACSGTGYKGRCGIYEFLKVDESIQQMILDREHTKDIHHAAVKGGMVTMRQDGLLKVKRGMSTIEELLRVIV